MRIHTRAFAIAAGTTAGSIVFLLTLLFIAGGVSAGPSPLRHVLFGYSVSVAGAFVGALWAYAYGFMLGGLFAFTYNIAVVPAPPQSFQRESEMKHEEA